MIKLYSITKILFIRQEIKNQVFESDRMFLLNLS